MDVEGLGCDRFGKQAVRANVQTGFYGPLPEELKILIRSSGKKNPKPYPAPPNKSENPSSMQSFMVLSLNFPTPWGSPTCRHSGFHRLSRSWWVCGAYLMGGPMGTSMAVVFLIELHLLSFLSVLHETWDSGLFAVWLTVEGTAIWEDGAWLTVPESGRRLKSPKTQAV